MLKSLMLATTLTGALLSPFNSIGVNQNIITTNTSEFLNIMNDEYAPDTNLHHNNADGIPYIIDEVIFELPENQLVSIYVDEAYILGDGVNSEIADLEIIHSIEFNNGVISSSLQFVINDFVNDAYTSYELKLDNVSYDDHIYLDFTCNNISGGHYVLDYSFSSTHEDKNLSGQYDFGMIQGDSRYYENVYFSAPFINFFIDELREYNNPINNLFYAIYKGTSGYTNTLINGFSGISTIFYANNQLTPISILLLVGICFGICKFGVNLVKKLVRK